MCSAYHTTIRISEDHLRNFIECLFQHLDVPAVDAQIAADVLVRADLRGVESHGINNLLHYVDGLRNRGSESAPKHHPWQRNAGYHIDRWR
ncbi:Ldh family oxidoreductase [Chloroflexi bacterium TSY]|nr:Ldh family oxidoreductase [Chloroflexi bacterium TSY]